MCLQLLQPCSAAAVVLFDSTVADNFLMFAACVNELILVISLNWFFPEYMCERSFSETVPERLIYELGNNHVYTHSDILILTR